VEKLGVGRRKTDLRAFPLRWKKEKSYLIVVLSTYVVFAWGV
jgi:hypothetical protein